MGSAFATRSILLASSNISYASIGRRIDRGLLDADRQIDSNDHDDGNVNGRRRHGRERRIDIKLNVVKELHWNRHELRSGVEDADFDVDPRIDKGEKGAGNHTWFDLRQRDEKERLHGRCAQ